MSPDFPKAILFVAIFGGAIAIIGTGALALGFRAIQKGRGSAKIIGLLTFVLSFVLVCCFVLLRMAMRSG